jgi:chromosome segregation ATPase
MSTHSSFEADNSTVYDSTHYYGDYAEKQKRDMLAAEAAHKADPIGYLRELRSQIAQAERRKVDAQSDIERAEAAIKKLTASLGELNKTFEDVKKRAVAMITEMTPK